VFIAQLKLHQIIVMISNTKSIKSVHLVASNYSFFLLETQCTHFAFYYIEFHAAVVLCPIKLVA